MKYECYLWQWYELIEELNSGSTVDRVQMNTYHFLNCPIHCSGGAHPGVPTGRLYSALSDIDVPKSVMTTLFG